MGADATGLETEVAETTESTEATETAETAESVETTEPADPETGLGDAPEPGTETPADEGMESETPADADEGLGEAPTGTVEGSEAETAEAETEQAPEVEDAEDAAELQDEIGTEEPPTVESEQDTSTDESLAPETDGDEGPDIGTAGAGDEMYEFDDEEREQVEEEYGLEFSSGSEVESPEESDLEPPEPDAGLEGEPGDSDGHAEPTDDEIDADELEEVEPAPGGTEEVVDSVDQAPEGSESAAAQAPGASIGEDEADESGGVSDDSGESGDQAVPENLEDTVMTEMRELNEGDGVGRETLLAAVVQAYDVTPADVEDALEAALMAGRCYESGEDTLKPI
ncbi:hypothetical protein ACFQJ6_06840 [Halorussus caseinilyticus]|uniref:Rpa-associated protein n=2 Tax=Halorussus caseinilyticus TaxID=3034025 RepID=A0ABD5WKG6_9EURY